MTLPSPAPWLAFRLNIKEARPDFAFILPYEIWKEYRFLFEKDIPTNLDLEPLIIFSTDELQFYPKYVDDTHVRLVTFLVDGAQVDYASIDSNGNNVLGYVVQTPRKDLFDFFVSKGVSPYHINKEGKASYTPPSITAVQAGAGP